MDMHTHIQQVSGHISAPYIQLPLAASMYGTPGSDTQVFIKAIAAMRVNVQNGMLNGGECVTAEGPEMAHLCRCFSFMPQQVLSQRTQYCLCRQ